jgi:hypothetical protein
MNLNHLASHYNASLSSWKIINVFHFLNMAGKFFPTNQFLGIVGSLLSPFSSTNYTKDDDQTNDSGDHFHILSFGVEGAPLPLGPLPLSQLRWNTSGKRTLARSMMGQGWF